MADESSSVLAPVAGGLKFPNPLEQLFQFSQAQNALNQNKQFQAEFGARRAIGQLLQQAIDPETGELDRAKAAQLFKDNPTAGFNAENFLQSQATLRGTTAQAHATEIANYANQTNVMYNQLAGLQAQGQYDSEANKPGVQRGDIIFRLGEMRKNGVDQDILNQAYGKLLKTPDTPEGNWNFVKSSSFQALTAKEKFDAQHQIVNLPLGNRTQPVVENQLTGTSTPTGPGYGQGTSPDTITAQSNELIPIKNPDGTTSYKTKAEVTGVQGIVGGGGAGSAPRAVAPAAVPAASSTPSGASIPPQRSAAPASPAPTNLNSPATNINATGGHMTGETPPPDLKNWDEAAEYQKDLNNRVGEGGNLLTRIDMLNQAEKLAASRGYTLTAPGHTIAQNAGRFAEAINDIGKRLFGIDQFINPDWIDAATGVDTTEEARKVLTQGAMNQWVRDTKAHRAITNSQTEEYLAANPRPDSDPRVFNTLQDFQKLQYSKDRQESQFFSNFRKEMKKDPSIWSDYQNRWADQMANRQIIDPENLNPKQRTGAAGAAGPVPTPTPTPTTANKGTIKNKAALDSIWGAK